MMFVRKHHKEIQSLTVYDKKKPRCERILDMERRFLVSSRLQVDNGRPEWGTKKKVNK